MDRDRLFLMFLRIGALLLILWGAATVLLLLVLKPSEALSARLVTAFAGMFSAYIGVAVGYLAGRR